MKIYSILFYSEKNFYGNEIYGVDTFEKFKFILNLFHKTNQNFYLISSGSGTKEFMSSGYYEEYKNRIIDFLIFCFDKTSYLPLLKTTKVSMVENVNFQNIIEQIKTKEPQINEQEYIKHLSSFLLLDEYFDRPIEIHEKIAKFFDENYTMPSFDESIKAKILDILNKIAQTKDDFEKAKGIIENIKNETDIINCYTSESIIVYFLNKCLREVDDKFIELAGLMTYALYKYYNDNPGIKINEDIVLYRKLTLSIKDLYAYDLFEKKIICFPSFTSTSKNIDAFDYPEVKKHKNSMYGTNSDKFICREKSVLIKISYKYKEGYECPCFSIKDISQFENEEEYVFPPFSFFRITNYCMNEGTKNDPVVIELEVIPKCIDFEKNLKNGGKVFYDINNNCFKCELNM